MDGLSPWERATLKVVYHRADAEHKGFLNKEDLKRLCSSLGVSLEEEELEELWSCVDTDHDGRASFRELLSHLTNNEGHVRDLQLRAAMTEQTALVATGAAIPLLLKGKTMIVVGTMFYDPMRLFRDFYVDYSSAFKSVRMAGKEVAHQDVKSVIEALRRGFKAGKYFRSTMLVVFAICVDCAVGACVFYLYAKIRAKLQIYAQKQLPTTTITKTVTRPKSTSSDNNNNNNNNEKNDTITKTFTRRRKFTQSEVCLLEAVSGASAGIFAGIIGPIARRTVTTELQAPNFDTIRRGMLRIRHTMSAHAAFFSGFYFFRNTISDFVYGASGNDNNNNRIFSRINLGLTPTTMKDALVTTGAGMIAGGCWRVASDPFKNRDDFVNERGIAKWRSLNFKEKLRIRGTGLKSALLQTMPVTGVAFLIYEASFSLLA